MKKNRWLYVVACVIVLLFAGLVYAWSVLSMPIAQAFPQYTNAQFSVTFTLTMSFFCLGVLSGGILLGKTKARNIIWLSAALFFIGFMLVSVMNSLPLLYLGFGILGGFASGLSYNAVMGTIMKWFPDRQGQVSGILLMGFGIGAFIIGKVYTATLPAGPDGWRTSFRIFAIILLVVLAVGALFCVKPEPEDVAEYQAIAARNNAGKSGKAGGADFSTAEMLRQPAFWFYFIWTILLSMAGLAFNSQSRGIIQEIAPGTAAGTIATVAGLFSIFNGIGRLGFGSTFDKFGFKKNMLLVCAAYVLATVVTILSMMTKSFPILVLAFVLMGCAYGGVTPTNSAIISSFFGLRHYALNFSMINLTLIISSFGGTIAGMIYDKSQTYFSVFLIIIAAAVLAAVVTMLMRKPEK